MHTKDEKVVLFHDVPVERNMEKLMGVTGQIGDFNYSELPVFKAVSRFFVAEDCCHYCHVSSFAYMFYFVLLWLLSFLP